MHIDAGVNIDDEARAAFNILNDGTFKQIESFMHILDDWVNEQIEKVKDSLPADFKIEPEQKAESLSMDK